MQVQIVEKSKGECVIRLSENKISWREIHIIYIYIYYINIYTYEDYILL